MTNPVDALAVARSLRRLDAIAAVNPEIVDREAPPWDLGELSAAIENGVPMPRKNKPAQVVAFRLDAELLGRIDAHAERMSDTTPGVTFTRVDAVRALLTRALDEIEAGEKRRKG